MITQYHHKKLTWIDLENPTTEDVATLIKEYAIHPGWAQELLSPSERAKTDTHEHSFYAVLHYPDHPGHMGETRDIEVDYVVSEKFLITAHYAPIDTFIEVAKHFQVDSTLDRARATTGAELFLELNNQLYRGLREELEPSRKQAKKIETEIFQGNEFRMVQEISHLGRRILDYKQSLRSHHIILKSLELQGSKLFPHTLIEEDRVFREYLRVESVLNNIDDILKELRATNDSLLTAKNNEVMKKLTLMAFVTFPLTLIVTVFGLHNAPALFASHGGFWVIVCILATLSISMAVYFKYKKWI
jgi:magnesium transporter